MGHEQSCQHGCRSVQGTRENVAAACKAGVKMGKRKFRRSTMQGVWEQRERNVQGGYKNAAGEWKIHAVNAKGVCKNGAESVQENSLN